MGGLLNSTANLIIVTGYLLVPALWLPWLPLQRWVLVAGSIFFLTCAITHIALAFHWSHDSGWMQVNHVVQAGAVMAFVGGFGRQLRMASARGKPGDHEESS